MSMSKRNNLTSKLCDSKKPKPWSLSLLDSMKDPDSIVKKTENAVVIKDKYPKAKLHYLILPFEDISSVTKLSSAHLPLLKDFRQLYEEAFISTDMISPCLKTKLHCNSFTTEHFIPLDEVIEELKLNNCIKKISQEAHKSLMDTPLKCNQCEFVPKNMPDLKKHLISHSSSS